MWVGWQMVAYHQQTFIKKLLQTDMKLIKHLDTYKTLSVTCEVCNSNQFWIKT